jgi:hypothetical protein
MRNTFYTPSTGSTPIKRASVSTRMAMQAKRNRIFAAIYKEACDIDPNGHKIFLEGIPRNNQINYLLIEQRKRAQKHIRAWNQHTTFPPIQDPYTHFPIVNYPRGLQGTPRQHEMVMRVPNANVGPRHHRCFMATVPPTPSLISRLFGPTMADATVHETSQGDHETSENEREETNSERSITMSDTTENIGELRRNLEATDLRNITPSARRNEHVYISEGTELASHNSQETKRNKRSSKMKRKQSKRESPRKRNNKKNSRRRQYKRNSSPDERHDSSSLSSHASSASSSEYTVSSDDDSFLAFESHKITNVTDIVSKKKTTTNIHTYWQGSKETHRSRKSI